MEAVAPLGKVGENRWWRGSSGAQPVWMPVGKSENPSLIPETYTAEKEPIPHMHAVVYTIHSQINIRNKKFKRKPLSEGWAFLPTGLLHLLMVPEASRGKPFPLGSPLNGAYVGMGLFPPLPILRGSPIPSAS